MNCTFGASKGNSIHGAEREFMAEPIHDNEVVNSLKMSGIFSVTQLYNQEEKNEFSKAL